MISTSTRLAAAKGNDVWMRVVMLAPSASNAMSTTVLGDTDMTLMRSYFVKPQAAIAMTFSEDPMMGMTMRPVYRIGDRQARHAVVRAAHRRRCAKRAQLPQSRYRPRERATLNAVLSVPRARLHQAGKPALSRPAS